jgi:hypothetical protein
VAISYTVDQATSAATTTTTTSNTVSVVSGNLIVVGIAFELGSVDNLDGGTPVTNTGTAFTWTKIADTHGGVDGGDCRVALYSATATATQSCTVTHNRFGSGVATNRRITTFVISNQAATTPIPSGNIKVKYPGSATASETITPTATGSLMFMIAGDWNQVNSYTALTNNTVDSTSNIGGAYTTALIRPTSNPLSSGSAFTLGATCTGARSVHVAFEAVAQAGSPYTLAAATGAFAVAGPATALATSQPTWTFVGVTEAAVTAAASTSYTLTEPAGVAQGDLLIVDFAVRGAVIFTNAAWTFAQSDTGGNTTNATTAADTSFQAGYCIRGASAPSYVFTRAGTGSRGLGTVRAYRSNKGAPVFDTSTKLAQTTASATITMNPSVTTATTNELITSGVYMARAAGVADNASNMVGATNLTGASGTINTSIAPQISTWTERSDRGNATSPSVSLACYDAVKPTSGATGSLSVTGPASALNGMVVMAFRHPVYYSLSAEAGAFVLAGVDATLTKGAGVTNYTLPADTGAFTLAGQAATLLRTRVMPAATGAFALAGQAAVLARGLPAGTGAFAVAGQAAVLARGLPVTPGAFTLAGQAATLTRTRVMPAATGAFALAGQAATLRWTRVMPAATGAFALAGPAVGLNYSGTTARVLTAATGVFTLAGQAATLRRTWVMPAATGAFVVAGQAATLTKAGGAVHRTMPADTGAFTLAGQAATLRYAHKFAAATSAFVLAGQPAALVRARTLTAAAGAFTLAGQPAVLRRTRQLPVTTGAFTLAGQAADLNYRPRQSYRVDARPGVFLINGQWAITGSNQVLQPGIVRYGRRITIANRW